jgi:hypothetical protein
MKKCAGEANCVHALQYRRVSGQLYVRDALDRSTETPFDTHHARGEQEGEQHLCCAAE